MKSVAVLRSAVTSIPGALYDFDPNDAERGNEPGVVTLWPESDLGRMDALGKSQPEDAEDAIESLPPPVEEIFEIGAEMDAARLVDAFGGETGERIRRAVELQGGIDSLAWYVTFHAKGAQWGIYVPITSVGYLMTTAFAGLKTDDVTKFRIAFRALHQHELFHFAVDYMAAQWESITGRACHKPARRLRDAAAGYILLEEQLAKAS